MAGALRMGQRGKLRTEQARRVGRVDRLKRPDLVGRDAAGAQHPGRLALRIFGEQRAERKPPPRGGGLDAPPDREGRAGGELLVHHLQEQPVGEAGMARRRHRDRTELQEDAVQRRRDRGGRPTQALVHVRIEAHAPRLPLSPWLKRFHGGPGWRGHGSVTGACDARFIASQHKIIAQGPKFNAARA